KHRPKNFFPGDGHIVLYVAEDSRLDKESFAAVKRNAIPSGDQLRAFILTRFDVAEHGLHLLLAHDRSHAGFWIKRIRWLHFLRPRHQLFGEFVANFAFDEQARAGVADLAFSVKNSVDRATDCPLEVRVGTNDVGRFSTELEGYALQRIGGGP